MRIRSILLLLAAAVLPSTVHAGVIFTLDPASGTVAGQPGWTVGWGFTLTNPDPTYVIVTGAEYQPVSPFGLFTDFISTQFIVLGPAPEPASVTQVFDAVAHTGVGSFTIDPAAPMLDKAVGSIILTYDVYNRDVNDPFFNPDPVADGGDLLAKGVQVSQSAQVNVVPEPACFLLAGPALLLLFRRKQRAR